MARINFGVFIQGLSTTYQRKLPLLATGITMPDMPDKPLSTNTTLNFKTLGFLISSSTFLGDQVTYCHLEYICQTLNQ